MLFLVVV